MQADIYVDGQHVSTGHAEEKRTASKINQTSALRIAKHRQLVELLLS
jgi:hypothetical protein